MKAIIGNALFALAIFASVHGAKGQVTPAPKSSPQSLPVQTTPFGFHAIRLGMSIAEFKTKHPAPKSLGFGITDSPRNGQAVCSAVKLGPEKRVVAGMTACNYRESFLDVSFQVEPTFVDGKLALITVLPPQDMMDAGLNLRKDHPSLLSELSGSYGHPKQFGNPELWDVLYPSQFYALRWENVSSVAEYEDRWCSPLGNPMVKGTDDGWSKEIAELLDGSYCSDADDADSARQPVIFYLHKELGKTLMMRLAKTTD